MILGGGLGSSIALPILTVAGTADLASCTVETDYNQRTVAITAKVAPDD